MFSRFQDQLLANLSSVRQFLLPSLLFCLGLFRLVISNLTLKFFLGIFRVALLFICQGTVCFVLRSRLPSLELLNYYIVSISFCQALFSFFFQVCVFAASLAAPGFPFAVEFYIITLPLLCQGLFSFPLAFRLSGKGCFLRNEWYLITDILSRQALFLLLFADFIWFIFIILLYIIYHSNIYKFEYMNIYRERSSSIQLYYPRY